jgi:putative FmdB family regulatory protein
MPTYEYRCAACAHTFEEFQSMTADPFEICPQCGKSTLKRVMGGGAGLIFKGSGFYLTDYRKGGSSSSPKNSSDGKPPSSGGSSSDAKPASGTEDKT